jgi:hypothetical protein
MDTSKMAIISGLIAVAFFTYLVLRIVGMIGGYRTDVALQTTRTPEKPPPFDPNRFNTSPLPKRTQNELEQLQNPMRTEWVAYGGATPPLRLHVRGQSYEGFRRVTRKHIDLTGQDNFDRLSQQQKVEFLLPVIAEAYVLDWEGAQYANGNAMPFSPANLAIMMAKDPHFGAFVQSAAERLSPPWPTR